MGGKSCFFIGHREASEEIYPVLYAAVEQHIVEYGVAEFFVGHYGGFDRLAALAVKEAKRFYPEVKLTLLLPYHPAERPISTPDGFDSTFYPPGMESVPRKIAIVRANRYVVDHVDYGNGIMEIRMRIQMSKLNSVQLPVPPSDVQHKIAAYLDCKCSQIDAIIARQKEVIEKLKAYKLSVITEAVTSTDSQMCRFRNCITTIEQGWSPAPAEIVGEDGWFVLSLSAVKNGKFIKLSKKPIDANENIPTKLSIKVGDLLMTRSNTRELVGDVCLVDSDCPKTIFSDLIYRISLNDTLLPCYAIFLLQSAFIRQQIQESARGSSGTMPKISHKSIKNLNIYLPSIPEQRGISGFLRNKCNYIDTCIQEKERLIKKLTAYKKSLIYEVVTGKKEV